MKKGNGSISSVWLLLLLSLAAFMVVLDTSVVSTSLSTIQKEFGASLAALEWIVNSYILTFAVLLMTASAMGDRFGRRRMFAAGIGIFTAASVACALAHRLEWLIAFRAIQGVGAALIMPLAVAILSASFPPETRAKIMGIFSGIIGLAVIAGPVVGGAVTEGLSWPWIFWLNAPIGGLLLGALWNRIDESYGPNRELDLPGILFAACGVLSLVWGLIRTDSAAWLSLEILLPIAGGIFFLLLFVFWGSRSRHPMLPMRMFRNRAFSMGNTANFLLYSSLISALFFISQYLQIAHGYSPFEAGLRMLPWTASIFLVAPAAGSVVKRIGEKPLIVVGHFMHAAGMLWIGLIAAPDTSYTHFVAPMLISGCGLSMAQPSTMSAVMGSVAPYEIGKASGVFNTLRQLGSVFGIAILATVFHACGGYDSAQSFTDGFSPAIIASSILSFAGGMAALRLPSRNRQLEAKQDVLVREG
ncbi:MFS transporter [Cohnella sp. AR92]|uniref:MFS transporter n=1 Tax=Cohnella sp. AR92 TaxID=648716 RepID=UPI000F8F2953|nr:MFS transporter [Cohnella sp. AR92]RUS46103.1 DHA2 family efflux MFS transporter permease subunit [Cohnella sp. AR92]